MIKTVEFMELFSRVMIYPESVVGFKDGDNYVRQDGILKAQFGLNSIGANLNLGTNFR